MGTDSGKSESLTITNEKGRLSTDEIDRLVAEAEEFKEDDDKRAAKAKAISSLEEKIRDIDYELNGHGKQKGKKDKMPAEEAEKVTEALSDARSWVSKNQEAETEDID